MTYYSIPLHNPWHHFEQDMCHQHCLTDLVLLSCFCRGLVTTHPWTENKPAAWSSWTILPHRLSALFSARSASYLQHVMLDSTIRGPSRDPAKTKNYFNMMVRYYVAIQIYLWLKILKLYLELFPFASDYGNKTNKKKKKRLKNLTATTIKVFLSYTVPLCWYGHSCGV